MGRGWNEARVVARTGRSLSATTDIRAAGPDDLDGILRLYREAGYPGGVGPQDRLFVAVSDRLVVGAFRLVREHHLLVLRGMRVTADRRAQGIGSRLLDELRDLDEPCYLISHARLEGFYGRVGFVAVPDAAAPAFLRARAREYRGRGVDVIVMRREQTRGRAGCVASESDVP